MDLNKLEKMTVNELLCHIRSSKKIKNNLSGYSKLNKTQLIEALKKFHEDGEKRPRVVKETDWSKALKIYNEGKETFLIPKKGSKEYNEVKDIISNGGKKVEKPTKQVRSKVRPLPNIITKGTATTKAVPDDEVEEVETSSKKAVLRKNPKRKIVFEEGD